MRPNSYYDKVRADMYDFYIAGPLFTEAEKDYNIKVCDFIRSLNFKCFLPQETESGTAHEIFQKNLAALSKSKAIIAICDGADMDSGTAWECGWAHGRMYVYALRSDFRKSADDPATGINLMIGQSAECVFANYRELGGYLYERKNNNG